MCKWIWADPHFGHKHIIEYENRPFNSVEDMDDALIENWNATVGKEDIGIMLGDISFYNRAKTESIVRQLNGRKWLVLGNHDGFSVSAYYDMSFVRVYDMPVIHDGFWILSHEPLYINDNMPYANIFGHVHSQKQYTDFSPQSYCVSVERIGYKPIPFDDIKAHIVKETEARE